MGYVIWLIFTTVVGALIGNFAFAGAALAGGAVGFLVGLMCIAIMHGGNSGCFCCFFDIFD
jgi:hypothetical protein